jgi:hypothetical protein
MSSEPEEKPDLEVKPLPVAIQRLIDEIKLAKDDIDARTGVHSYNRVYNRHNRS